MALVEVIFCKDCDYYSDGICEQFDEWGDGDYVEEDGFCKWAKPRRSDEEREEDEKFDRLLREAEDRRYRELSDKIKRERWSPGNKNARYFNNEIFVNATDDHDAEQKAYKEIDVLRPENIKSIRRVRRRDDGIFQYEITLTGAINR